MIYLDNAASTFPKPVSVYKAVRECMEEYCGNPGRSGHSLSLAAAHTVYDCRCELAEVFGCKHEENVVFTLNTTYALNMAIKALIRPGDHILISNLEHNAVLRPVVASGCDYDIFDANQSVDRVLYDIRSKLTPRTKMLIANHSSNICPLRNPIRSIGELCMHRGIYFVVDGAQSAGVYPIDMGNMNIDILCIAGHKSLYGIQGCGAAVFSDRFRGNTHKLHTLIEGGNGVNSLDSAMPELLPERLEAGTLATPAIAGLLAGLREVKSIGITGIRDHEQRLYQRVKERLCNIEGIKVYCQDMNYGQTLLFNVEGKSSEEVASLLDRQGICVRAGFHCAPLAHKTIGTGNEGAVRISPGAFNTLEEIDIATDTIYNLTK